MSSETAQGIAGLRGRLADRHPKFAAAEALEQEIEGACTRLRGNLKAARKALGIEQSTLAERMQVGQPMISRIENGTGDIGLKTLYRYADALGLSLVVDIGVTADNRQASPLDPTAAAIGEALENVDRARELLIAASGQLSAA